jgi:hypothetical protein
LLQSQYLRFKRRNQTVFLHCEPGELLGAVKFRLAAVLGVDELDIRLYELMSAERKAHVLALLEEKVREAAKLIKKKPGQPKHDVEAEVAALEIPSLPDEKKLWELGLENDAIVFWVFRTHRQYTRRTHEDESLHTKEQVRGVARTHVVALLCGSVSVLAFSCLQPTRIGTSGNAWMCPVCRRARARRSDRALARFLAGTDSMSLARLPRVPKRRASRSNDSRPSGNAPRNKHANRRLQRPHNRRRNNKRNEQRLSRAAPALYCLNFCSLCSAIHCCFQLSAFRR